MLKNVVVSLGYLEKVREKPTFPWGEGGTCLGGDVKRARP
jgi:hypothetical protein